MLCCYLQRFFSNLLWISWRYIYVSFQNHGGKEASCFREKYWEHGRLPTLAKSGRQPQPTRVKIGQKNHFTRCGGVRESLLHAAISCCNHHACMWKLILGSTNPMSVVEYWRLAVRTGVGYPRLLKPKLVFSYQSLKGLSPTSNVELLRTFVCPG